MMIAGQDGDDTLNYGLLLNPNWGLYDLDLHTIGHSGPTQSNWELKRRRLKTCMKAVNALQCLAHEAIQKALEELNGYRTKRS